MSNEPTVKRWTAKRKAAVVMDIFKGKTTAAELAVVFNPVVQVAAIKQPLYSGQFPVVCQD